MQALFFENPTSGSYIIANHFKNALNSHLITNQDIFKFPSGQNVPSNYCLLLTTPLTEGEIKRAIFKGSSNA